MKRNAKIISLLLVVIMIFSLFTACAKIDQALLSVMREEKRTPKILEMLDKTVNKADSYTLTSTGVVSTTVLGVDVTLKTTIDEAISGKNSDNPIKSATIKNEYKYSDESLNFSVERYDGYQGGYLYYGVTHDEYTSKLKSVASVEEFRAHDSEMSTITSLVGIPSENATSEKAEDGSWIVYVKGLGADRYKNIAGDIASVIPGYRIKSMDMTIRIKSDFSEWENEMSFNFEPIEDYDFSYYGFYVPVAVYTTKISAIGSSSASQVDIGSYTECADVDMITSFLSDLTKLFEKDNGKVSVGINHNIRYRGTDYKITEYDVVEYGVTNNAFYYNINAKVNGESLRISYSDGVRTQQDGTKLNSDDIAERAFLSGLVTGNVYNVLAVKDVRRDENSSNTYIIDMYMTEDVLAAFDINDVKMSQGSISFIVSYVDGEISTVKAEIRASASGVVGGAYYNIDIITMVLEKGTSV